MSTANKRQLKATAKLARKSLPNALRKAYEAGVSYDRDTAAYEALKADTCEKVKAAELRRNPEDGAYTLSLFVTLFPKEAKAECFTLNKSGDGITFPKENQSAGSKARGFYNRYIAEYIPRKRAKGEADKANEKIRGVARQCASAIKEAFSVMRKAFGKATNAERAMIRATCNECLTANSKLKAA